jgi:predicted DNA-binding antitoxin AbrB/MazE fold protein
MYAVKAVYDGNIFKLDEPVPVKGKYEVIITFTKPIEKTQEKILQYFDTWDDEDVNCMAEIIKERENFSLNRPENDIS